MLNHNFNRLLQLCSIDILLRDRQRGREGVVGLVHCMICWYIWWLNLIISLPFIFKSLSRCVSCRASDYPREYDGACLQMRMSYSPAAHLFLFLVQWTDCNLAGALGLLRILIYKVEACSFRWLLFLWVRFQSWVWVTIAFWLMLQVYVDGSTTIMSTKERKASIREFYGTFLISAVWLFVFCWALVCFISYWCLILWSAVIYPSLLQLQRGVTDSEDKKQKAVCVERYRKRDDEENRQCSDIDIEREEECGICMETNSKIVLPNCNHAMCLKCYRDWYSLSLSLY